MKFLNLILNIFLFSFLLSSVHAQFPTGSGGGVTQAALVGPYFQEVFSSDQGEIPQDRKRYGKGSYDYVDLIETSSVRIKVTNTVAGEELRIDLDESQLGDVDFCKEGGGLYRTAIFANSAKADSSEQPRISYAYFDSYYCNTVKDLLNVMRYPVTWNYDNLLVYCSLTGNKEFEQFILPESDYSDIYLVCVMENQDKQESLVYGFLYGNELSVDFNVVDIENEVFPQALNRFNYLGSEQYTGSAGDSIKYKFVDPDSLNSDEYSLYFFNPSINVSYFRLEKGEHISGAWENLKARFDLNKIENNLTNMVLMKQINQTGKHTLNLVGLQYAVRLPYQIYGYEVPEKILEGDFVNELDYFGNVDSKIYNIHFNIFGNISNNCMSWLSTYSPNMVDIFQPNGNVLCNKKNILIFEDKLNNAANNLNLEGNVAFQIFKNTIIDFTGNQSNFDDLKNEYCGLLFPMGDSSSYICDKSVNPNVPMGPGSWVPLKSHSYTQNSPNGYFSTLQEVTFTAEVNICKIRYSSIHFNDGGFVAVFDDQKRVAYWDNILPPKMDCPGKHCKNYGRDVDYDLCGIEQLPHFDSDGRLNWCLGPKLYADGVYGNLRGSPQEQTHFVPKGETRTIYSLHTMGANTDSHSYTLEGEICSEGFINSPFQGNFMTIRKLPSTDFPRLISFSSWSWS